MFWIQKNKILLNLGGIDSPEKIDKDNDISTMVSGLPEPVRSAVVCANEKLDLADLYDVSPVYIWSTLNNYQQMNGVSVTGFRSGADCYHQKHTHICARLFGWAAAICQDQQYKLDLDSFLSDGN